MALPLEVLKLIAKTNLEKMRSKFIFDKVFPSFEVPTTKGLILIDDDATVNQLNLKPTRAFDKAPQVNVASRTVQYTMHSVRRRFFVNPDEFYGLPEAVRDKEEARGTIRTNKSVLNAFEYWASRTLFNDSVWANSTPSTLWSNASASKPYTDLINAAYLAGEKGGIAINTIVFSPDAFRAWALSDEVAKKFSALDFQTATMERIVGAMTGIDLEGLTNIYVGKAKFTTSNESAGTVVKENFWKNGVWLGYIDPDVENDESDSAVAGIELMDNRDIQTREYKDPNLDPDSKWIESAGKRGFLVLDPDKGYFIENPV